VKNIFYKNSQLSLRLPASALIMRHTLQAETLREFNAEAGRRREWYLNEIGAVRPTVQIQFSYYPLSIF